MEDQEDLAENLACVLCHGLCGDSTYSLMSWLRVATIKSVLQESIPGRAEEFESPSKFICTRCYHAMDDLVKKKQEASEAESFIQSLAMSTEQQTPIKQEKSTCMSVITLPENKNSTPLKSGEPKKGAESDSRNKKDSLFKQQSVTLTRSGREYDKRKLPNMKNDTPPVPKKTLKQTEIDSSSKQLPSTSKGCQKTLPSRGQVKNTKTSEINKNWSQGQGRRRGRPKKLSVGIQASESSKISDSITSTNQKRGRGRPKKLSISTATSGSSKATGSVISTNQKRGRGRPKKVTSKDLSNSGIDFNVTKDKEMSSTVLHNNNSSMLITGMLNMNDQRHSLMEMETPANEGRNGQETNVSDVVGEITSDHSYHFGSPRVSGQEKIESNQLKDISDEFECRKAGFTEGVENDGNRLENEHSDDDHEDLETEETVSPNSSENISNDKRNPCTQQMDEKRMTTRIRSGTLARKFVVLDRGKLSKTNKVVMDKQSLQSGKTVLQLNPGRDCSSRSSPKKIVFLKASGLKAKKLEARSKESEKQLDKGSNEGSTDYNAEGKRILPLPKIKRIRKRRKNVDSEEIIVNPEIWTCSQCKAVRYEENEIRDHIQIEHNITETEKIDQCLSKRVVRFVTQKSANANTKERWCNSIKAKEIVSFTCMICNLKISRENNALTHVHMTHHKNRNDAPNYVKRNVSLEKSDKEGLFSENDVSGTNRKKTKKTAEQIKEEKLKRRRVLRLVKEQFQTKVHKWKCKICGQMYVSKSALRRHIVKQHIVADCDIKANTIRVLVDREVKTSLGDEDEDSSLSNNNENDDGSGDVQYLKTAYSEQTRMEDGKKGAISGRGRLKHGHNKPWRCGLCTIYYFHKCDVYRHLIQKHGLTREDAKSHVIQEKWQESTNKKYFATKVEVYTINNPEEEDYEKSADTEGEEELDPYNETQKPWKCIKCGKRLPTKKAALRHMRFPHEIYGPWARYHVRQIAPEQGSKSKKVEDEFHLDRDLLCVLCGRDYFSQVQAAQHIKDCHPDISDTMTDDVLLKKSQGSRLIVLSLPGEVTRNYHIDSKGRIKEVDLENIPSLKQKSSQWDKKTFTFFDEEMVESETEIIDEERETSLITSSEELTITHADIFFLNWENYCHEEESTELVVQDGQPWQCSRCQKGLSSKLIGVQHVAHVHDIKGPWARHILQKTNEWKSLLEKTILPERDWLCVYCGRHYKTIEDAHRHVKGWHPMLTAKVQESLVLQKSGGCKGIILTTGNEENLTFLIDSCGRIKEVDTKSTDFEDFVRRCSFDCQQDDSGTNLDEEFDVHFIDTDDIYTHQAERKQEKRTSSSQVIKSQKMVSLLSSKTIIANEHRESEHQENITDMTTASLTTPNSFTDMTTASLTTPNSLDSLGTTREQRICNYKCSNPNSQKKEYVCQSCPLVFSSNKHASYHRLYHRHAVRWRCRKCGEAFYYISHLAEHINKVHNGSFLSIILDMEEILDNKPNPNSLAQNNKNHTESISGKEALIKNLTQNGVSDAVINTISFVTSEDNREEDINRGQPSSAATNDEKEEKGSSEDVIVEDGLSGAKIDKEPDSQYPDEQDNSSEQEEEGLSDQLDFESGNYNPSEKRKGKISCEVCGLFVPVKSMQSHMTLFHGVMTYRCMECHQNFVSLEAVDNHVHQVHEGRFDNDKRVHPCIICNTVWRNRPDLLDHLDRHKADGCCCTVCGEAFHNMNKLKSHMSVHNSSYQKGNDRHQCFICGKSIVTMKNFIAHTRNHYDEHHKKFQCEVCKKFVKTRSCLAEHMRNHTHEDMLCPYCAKQFTSRVNYLRHIKYHENPELFSCKECGLQLSTLTGLRRHQKFHHTVGLGKTVCHICGKSLRNLKWHVKHVHGDENRKSKRPPKKSRTCEFCGKVFRLPHMMERHKVVHTGEKPFQCHFCNKTFSFRTSYKAHLNSHPEYMPYKCAVCDTQFQMEKDFIDHRAQCRGGQNGVEFPFQCEVCKRVFRSTRSLRTHLDRKHQMEKHSQLPGSMRHYCQICQKGYFYKDSLTRHMYSAHRERKEESVIDENIIIEETSAPQEENKDILNSTYKCELCGSEFNLLEQLNEHVDTHHSDPGSGINIQVFTKQQDGVHVNDLDNSSVITIENEEAAQLLSQLQLQMEDGQEMVNVIIPIIK
ncbi:zinc finger protein Xfin-like [Ylistrum balloti]|uniref:zinc finger protein Xfin-like n=1 Tax=Ylistrum balloti TaxID=509963 RepID=UPI002905F188|nr:zinc finger protein Xfin-like [Ylistrum balloti]